MAPRASAAARGPRPEKVDQHYDESGEFPKMLYGPKGAERKVRHADAQAQWEAEGYVEDQADLEELDDEADPDATPATDTDGQPVAKPKTRKNKKK